MFYNHTDPDVPCFTGTCLLCVTSLEKRICTIGRVWGRYMYVCMHSNVCLLGHNKVTHTGWIKQQKCIFSHLWRLEVQDHWFLLSSVREHLFYTSPLTSGVLLAIFGVSAYRSIAPTSAFIFTGSSCPWLYVCVQISCADKNTSRIGFEAHLLHYDLILTYLIPSTVTPFPNKFTFWSIGVRTSTNGVAVGTI